MLHLWNSPARLEVGAGQVLAWIATPGKPVVKAAVPLLAQDENAGTHPQGEYGALAVAIRNAIMLLSDKWSRPIRSLDIEIGDSHVFYDVIETDTRAACATELRRLARLALADIFGLDPAGLVARCAVQCGGRSMVACVTPLALTEAIRDAVASAGCRIDRLQPGFAAFLNRHRSLLKGRHALIARLDGDLLMLALLDDSRWRAFTVERLLSGSWPALRDSCDSFCRRLCIIESDRFPVWYHGDVDHIVGDPDPRWSRLPATPSSH